MDPYYPGWASQPPNGYPSDSSNQHADWSQAADDTDDLTGTTETPQNNDQDQVDDQHDEFGGEQYFDDDFQNPPPLSDAELNSDLHYLQEKRRKENMASAPSALGGNAGGQGIDGNGGMSQEGHEQGAWVEDYGPQGAETINEDENVEEDDDEEEDDDPLTFQIVWDPTIANSQQANAYLFANRHLREVRPKDDDVQAQQPHLAAHAKSIFDAIGNPPPKGSSKTTWTAKQQGYYDDYQTTGWEDLTQALSTTIGQKKTQSQCVLLVQKAFDLHASNITITNEKQKVNKDKAKMKFSDRVSHFVTAMRIKRTACSLSQGDEQSILALVQDPVGVLNAREHSAKNNSHKKTKVDAYNTSNAPPGGPRLPRGSKTSKAKSTKSKAPRKMGSNFLILPGSQSANTNDQTPDISQAQRSYPAQGTFPFQFDGPSQVNNPNPGAHFNSFNPSPGTIPSAPVRPGMPPDFQQGGFAFGPSILPQNHTTGVGGSHIGSKRTHEASEGVPDHVATPSHPAKRVAGDLLHNTSTPLSSNSNDALSPPQPDPLYTSAPDLTTRHPLFETHNGTGPGYIPPPNSPRAFEAQEPSIPGALGPAESLQTQIGQGGNDDMEVGDGEVASGGDFGIIQDPFEDALLDEFMNDYGEAW